MTTNLTINTGRFSNPEVKRSTMVPVGIVRYFPRWPVGYVIVDNIAELAPTSAMLAMAKDGKGTPSERAKRFDLAYEKQLEKIGALQIMARLRQVAGHERGIVLLCYEDVTDGVTRCHRRQLALWIEKKTGVKVPEIADAGTAAAKKAKKLAEESKQTCLC